MMFVPALLAVAGRFVLEQHANPRHCSCRSKGSRALQSLLVVFLTVTAAKPRNISIALEEALLG